MVNLDVAASSMAFFVDHARFPLHAKVIGFIGKSADDDRSFGERHP